MGVSAQTAMAAESVQSSKWRAGLNTRRRLWLKVHLWLGLTVGAVFVVTGLTGSILAFWVPLDEWLNRDLLRVAAPAGARPRPLAEIEAAARGAMSAAAKPEWGLFPYQTRNVFVFVYRLPAGNEDRAELWRLAVDPYTARVIGMRLLEGAEHPWRGSFINAVVRLHYTLWLREAGAVIAGGCALLLLFSVLTGLILWWPLTGKWRQALSFKRRPSFERLVFDLHKLAGFYPGAVFLLVLFSGVYMIFPQHTRALVSVFSPLSPAPEGLRSTPRAGLAPIGLERAVAIAEREFPDGTRSWFRLPADAQDVYQVCKRAPGEPNRYFAYRCVWLDQYTGQPLLRRDPRADSAGDTFLEWQYPLHTGEAFGMAGRFLILLIGLGPALLYVTGFIRWRQKRRSRSTARLVEPCKGRNEK